MCKLTQFHDKICKICYDNRSKRKVRNTEQTMETTEKKEYADARKNWYSVRVKRDMPTLLTFAKFVNRIKHPRATVFMVSVGAMLTALPIVNKEIAFAGVVVCYIMGPVLLAFGLFRHYLSVYLMKTNSDVTVDEELLYHFGNSGVRVEKNGIAEHVGYYKDVYKIWEDEKNYYVGMNEDDLLVLPMKDFEEGNAGEFRDFIVEKSSAPRVWAPTRPGNIVKLRIMEAKSRMMENQMEMEEEREKRKNKKK